MGKANVSLSAGGGRVVNDIATEGSFAILFPRQNYGTVCARTLFSTITNISREEAEANAARIVTCVNACEGIADPSGIATALTNLHGLVERLATEIKAVGPWSDTAEGKRIAAFAEDAIRTADLLVARAEGRK
ncbi:MAG TPA: hypothetical protein VL588_11400 [Bdellovibrionota bacterium]|nr:hypothetical protein [Bdellovibrionota bacterium]